MTDIETPKPVQNYYSPGTGGFYRSDIHGDDIPEDAQKITAERHAVLMQDQSAGKEIKPSSTGKPMASKPKVSAEQIARNMRHQRDQALRDSDVALIRALEDGQDIEALKTYRNALRDLPEQKGWPKVDLPTLTTD